MALAPPLALRCRLFQETEMREIGILISLAISLAVAVILAIILPFILSGERWKAAQEKARARRLADAKMNARLLRLNL